MRGYLLRRLEAAALLLAFAALGSFALAALVPGDPALILVSAAQGEAPPSPEAVERVRAELRLDRPWHVRFLSWAGCLTRGDLGRSWWSGRPVASELLPCLGRSLAMALLSTALLAALALLAAVAAARRPGGPADAMSLAATNGLTALPSFVLGLLLILLLALPSGLLPVAGSETPRHYLLPALTLGIAGAPAACRLLRAGLLEELSRPYAAAARARGASELRVVGVHALRNAAIPFVAMLWAGFREIVATAPIVETLFGFRGLASQLVASISSRDLPMLQGSVLLFAAVIAAAGFAADCATAALDPRIRFAGEGAR
jgi:peptide/nickel transport system permease protein